MKSGDHVQFGASRVLEPYNLTMFKEEFQKRIECVFIFFYYFSPRVYRLYRLLNNSLLQALRRRTVSIMLNICHTTAINF